LAVVMPWCSPVQAQTESVVAAVSPAVSNSNLDAQLFYQLLIGEIELRDGQAGTAFQVVLDAARRTRDEQLFRRATEIALQARAGDQALSAAAAWRTTLPNSAEAHRFLVQLLVALNRPLEAVEPLRSLLALTPAAERPALIQAVPRFFTRLPDRTQAVTLVEQVVQPYLETPATRVAARVAIGRAWLAVPDTAKALEQARRAQALDANDEAPALLALAMLPGTPDAEALVAAQLQAHPENQNVRMGYVRALTGAQRYGEAVIQLETLTRAAPQLAPAWLTLGALQVELHHPPEARAALEKYLSVVDAAGAPATPPAATPVADADEEPDETMLADDNASQGRTQAWLLLAQAAEQQGDFKAAEGWLGKVDSPQRALEVQSRRASLLAKQGKVAEARSLVRLAPERGPTDARAKLLAEAQILRDVKQWGDAGAVLAQANEKFPGDVDLLYEQSMVAEKLNRLDEMERLLRRVIELKPDHHHAYNALGYSLAERNLRLPEAKALIRKALDLSPGEPFITDSLGWVEYRLGNRDEALRLLRGAYQSRPDPEIGAHLGEVLWVNGQRDEARRIWREARTRDSANDVLRETLARLRVDL
jgi:tetratricopeptide (TPR) repeat protein